MKKEELYFSTISTCYKAENKNKNIVVSYGGGSYGGEGYVVVQSTKDSSLIWIAFFEEANPFENIKLNNEKINVCNNIKEEWSFDLNNPANLSISYLL